MHGSVNPSLSIHPTPSAPLVFVRLFSISVSLYALQISSSMPFLKNEEFLAVALEYIIFFFMFICHLTKKKSILIHKIALEPISGNRI